MPCEFCDESRPPFNSGFAQISRHHNDANVLSLSGDLTGDVLLRKIVEAWLNTEFYGGRHQRRGNKIKAIEKSSDPEQVKNG